MDFEFILKDLKADFKGQRLLYVKDIATLLGRTDASSMQCGSEGELPILVRRADFLTIKNSFSPGHSRPGIMPGVSTYRAVQICDAASLHV